MENAIRVVLAWIFMLLNTSFVAHANRVPEDFRIAEMFELTHRSYFEMAALALNHAASAELQEFAHSIATEFAEITSPISYTGSHPQARILRHQISRMKSELLQKSGVSFDRSFIEKQELWNLQLLRLIDRDLLKNVENAELKNEIKKLKENVREYLAGLQTVELPSEGLSISKAGDY